MKLSKWIAVSVLGLIVSIGAIGCKTSPPTVTKFDNKSSGSKPTLADLPAAPALGTSDAVAGKDLPKDGSIPLDGRRDRTGWNENHDAFKGYTVHFEYDSTVIRDSEKSKLEAIATQLNSIESAAVKIEGHCDERGTEEYNRSLGERRALALREELARMGVEPNRLDTISYGDIKPAVVGHDESAWKQNRRGEFVQLTPPQ